MEMSNSQLYSQMHCLFKHESMFTILKTDYLLFYLETRRYFPHYCDQIKVIITVVNRAGPTVKGYIFKIYCLEDFRGNDCLPQTLNFLFLYLLPINVSKRLMFITLNIKLSKINSLKC